MPEFFLSQFYPGYFVSLKACQNLCSYVQGSSALDTALHSRCVTERSTFGPALDHPLVLPSCVTVISCRSPHAGGPMPSVSPLPRCTTTLRTPGRARSARARQLKPRCLLLRRDLWIADEGCSTPSSPAGVTRMPTPGRNCRATQSTAAPGRHCTHASNRTKPTQRGRLCN